MPGWISNIWFSGLVKLVCLVVVALSVLTSCQSPPVVVDKPTLTKISFADLSGWYHDDVSMALAAFKKSCERMLTLPKDRMLHMTGIGGNMENWNGVCKKALDFSGNSAKARQFFQNYFTPYQVSNGENKTGLFTGYYEIGLLGSRKRHGAFQNPVYKRPQYLPEGKPYYQRKDIESGILDGKNLELLWMNDPISVFFLHIQGSGLVYLDDGSITRVGYDGKNNHPYTALGRYMIEQDWLRQGQVTAQTIKDWLIDHPYYYTQVMNENASYVFFRELKTSNGPIGAQGVELTPQRSLAVDKQYIPYGVPVWLETTIEDTKGQLQPFHRLMVAQDTGGAIKGKVRGDIFFGAGDDAQHHAGTQKSSGSYVMLLPK